MAQVARSVSVDSLLARLWNEVRQMERVGHHAHAAGIRQAITILLREADSLSQQAQSLDPST